MALTALIFCATGIAIGSRLENVQAFPFVINFLLMPLFFLSGALFPLDGLPESLKVVTSFNPLSYGVDALRGTLTGVTQFGLGVDAAVLVVIFVALVILGAYSFSKMEI